MGITPEVQAFLDAMLVRMAAMMSIIEEQDEKIRFLMAENAMLRGKQKKPDLKPPRPPSGMQDGTGPGSGAKRSAQGRGTIRPSVPVKDRIVRFEGAEPGWRFKGYSDSTHLDLAIEVVAERIRREIWQRPDGTLVVAPMPEGACGLYGPTVALEILDLYHRGQMTVGRIVERLNGLGLDISERQVMRMLLDADGGFRAEAEEVLEAGLETAPWIGVDDTGARHEAANGICTVIQGELFSFFATTKSKSRLNFLELLSGSGKRFVLNDASFAYMRAQKLRSELVAALEASSERLFETREAFEAHLSRIGFDAVAPGRGRPRKMPVDPKDPPQSRLARIALEAGLWGAVVASGRLRRALIVSDGAGQFALPGLRSACHVHAERHLHELVPATPEQKALQAAARDRYWTFYRGLREHAAAPDPLRRALLEAEFDAMAAVRTGWEDLDRVIAAIGADREDLLRPLARPDVPPHNNSSENDIRCQVTRRKISFGTRTEAGRDCRDAFLGLMKTCHKLGIAFREYLASRLGIVGAKEIDRLPGIIRERYGQLAQAAPA